jgi:hypothetical protein
MQNETLLVFLQTGIKNNGRKNGRKDALTVCILNGLREKGVVFVCMKVCLRTKVGIYVPTLSNIQCKNRFTLIPPWFSLYS